jgi:hypothetical protein
MGTDPIRALVEAVFEHYDSLVAFASVAFTDRHEAVALMEAQRLIVAGFHVDLSKHDIGARLTASGRERVVETLPGALALTGVADNNSVDIDEVVVAGAEPGVIHALIISAGRKADQEPTDLIIWGRGDKERMGLLHEPFDLASIGRPDGRKVGLVQDNDLVEVGFGDCANFHGSSLSAQTRSASVTPLSDADAVPDGQLLTPGR